MTIFYRIASRSHFESAANRFVAVQKQQMEEQFKKLCGCQFHQHFARAFIVRKSFLQLFSSYM